MTEIDLFTGEHTVLVHQNVSLQPGSSNAINFGLRSQSAPQSPLQMNPDAAPTSTPLRQAQPTVQDAADVNGNMPPIARELKRALQSETKPSIVEAVTFSSFLNTRIQLRERFQE